MAVCCACNFGAAPRITPASANIVVAFIRTSPSNSLLALLPALATVNFVPDAVEARWKSKFAETGQQARDRLQNASSRSRVYLALSWDQSLIGPARPAVKCTGKGLPGRRDFRWSGWSYEYN